MTQDNFDVKELVDVLRFNFGFFVKDLAKRLDVHVATLHRYIKEGIGKYNQQLISLMDLDSEGDILSLIGHTKGIKALIANIDLKDWKDLILGLEEKLDITQYELLDKFRLKENSVLSRWINDRSIPLHTNKFRIVEFIKENNLNVNDLIDYGRKVRRGLRINNQWIFPDKIYKKSDFNDLFVGKGDRFFLNTPLLFPIKFKDHLVRFILRNNGVIVFYREKRSTRPEPLVLPRHLEVGEDFLVGFGIYFAEGSRNRRPKITNSEPKIINQAIKFFELIGVEKSKLKAWIQLHERSMESFSNVKEFWLNNTSLEEDNIVKVRLKKSMGNAKIKQEGTLHLESYFILSQLFVKGLLTNIYDMMKYLSKDQKIWFLRGAFAGEGYVNIAKSGSVSMVQYTTTNIKERRLIKRLLQEMKLRVHEDDSSGNLAIMGFYDIKKLFDFDIFKYHPWRKNRLFNGFNVLKTKRVPGTTKLKIIDLLKNKTTLTTTDIVDNFDFNERGIRRHLDELHKIGKIHKMGGSGPIPDKWLIND